jgi:hypothetical protein
MTPIHNSNHETSTTPLSAILRCDRPVFRVSSSITNNVHDCIRFDILGFSFVFFILYKVQQEAFGFRSFKSHPEILLEDYNSMMN